MKEIQLTQGKLAMVDDADFNNLAQFKWRAQRRKNSNLNNFYAIRNVDHRNAELMHRAILGLKAGDIRQCDHINGCSLDNRRVNLRIATFQQNGFNRGKNRNNTSGFKGVYFHRVARRWAAHITISGTITYLGLFDSPELAAAAYDGAAMLSHGHFAKFNFPKQKQPKEINNADRSDQTNRS